MLRLKNIIILLILTAFYFLIPKTLIANIGVYNNNNYFIKKLSNRFKLKKYLHKKKINNKTTLTFRDYRNIKLGIILWFKFAPKKEDKSLKSIYILSKYNLKAIKIGRYFISHLRADKKAKIRWKKYLNKVSFEKTKILYKEKGQINYYLTCLTQKIYNPKKKKNIYHLRLKIIQ